MGLRNYVGTFLKKLVWNALSEIPVLSVLTDSLRDTMDEMNKEMGTVHNKIRTELQEQLKADFPSLEYQPLPIPEKLAITVETAIDVEHTDVKES